MRGLEYLSLKVHISFSKVFWTSSGGVRKEFGTDWKRLDGSELDGSEHFETNCQNIPGAAGAAVGAAAGAAAASAVCIYYVITGGRFAPPYEYMIKCI